MFPLPLVPLDPVQLIIEPAMHEVRIMFIVLPEQIESVACEAVTMGTLLMVTVFDKRPLTVCPQASVIVGAGTVNEALAPHVVGHKGLVTVKEAVPVLVHDPEACEPKT